MKFIKFKPIYMERVWGGTNLKKEFNRDTQPGKVIGESWEISDRPEACSVICGGQYDGKTIRQAIEADSTNIMGPNWDKNKKFPILVKWLDCEQRLSLQVHPPMSVAPKLGGEPKTENWYIAKCRENSHLIAGLKKGATKQEFIDSLKDNSAEKLLWRFPVSEGDSLFVQSGRLHAIDGGNIILEIQQNSDTTYRVYDWGRVGLDGKPRKLHINESIESINFDDFEPQPVSSKGKDTVLCSCKEFSIRTVNLKKGDHLKFAANEQPRILSITKGSLACQCGCQGKVELSDNVLLPYANGQDFVAESDTVALITENFA